MTKQGEIIKKRGQGRCYEMEPAGKVLEGGTWIWDLVKDNKKKQLIEEKVLREERPALKCIKERLEINVMINKVN